MRINLIYEQARSVHAALSRIFIIIITVIVSLSLNPRWQLLNEEIDCTEEEMLLFASLQLQVALQANIFFQFSLLHFTILSPTRRMFLSRKMSRKMTLNLR